MRKGFVGPRSDGSSIFLATAAVLLLPLMLGTARAQAGGSSAQPRDTLSVTGSPTPSLLAQTQAASSEGWLSGLHVTGYANQLFGMWQNPRALKDFTTSRNNLATSRSLLQVDENYRLNADNTFFMREWFVYEPPYDFNSANNGIGTNITNAFTTPFCPAFPACLKGRLVAPSFGHFGNDYYNNYSVRDAWWENKTGPLKLFVGNQIVVWGQSLAFRVGDVINPQDFAWSFGFANLEQSRNPQWMIHPILNLPELGPLTANFLELVVQPGFQPQWWEDSTPDGRWTGPGASTKDGRTVTVGIHAQGSWRFDVHYDNQWNPALNAATGFGPSYGPGSIFPPGGPPGGTLAGAPFVHTFWECLGGSAVPGQPGHFFNPLPPGLRKSQGAGCNQALSHNNLKFGPAGNFALFNTGPWRIPGMQPENWNDGVRLHTLAGATELTAFYYNDNVNGGIPQIRYLRPYYTNLMEAYFPDIQDVGITADRPAPLPEAIGEHFPAVMRAEMVYVNHESFYDDRPLAFSAVRYSDVVKWMTALDLDQAYAPWLTSTGTLSANLEVYDSIIMDNSKLTPVGALISQKALKNDISILFNIGTGYFYEDIEPTWTMIYEPKGTTFALFPTLVLNPPWTKKYFLKLQAIEVMGGDRQHALGLFKGESLLSAQFQYNFDLL
jgi:uncharacterized protein DUF1302